MQLRLPIHQEQLLNATKKRKLHSNNWKNLQNYISHRLKLFKHYKISEKVEEIKTLMKHKDSKPPRKPRISASKNLRQLDKQNTRVCLQAESLLPEMKTTLLL